MGGLGGECDDYLETDDPFARALWPDTDHFELR